MWDKLGIVFFTLLILLFRTAEFISYPQVSPVTPIILCMLAKLYDFSESMDLWLGTYLWWPVMQFIMFYGPMQCGCLIIWLASIMFYGVAWVVWWTRYLTSRWKYLAISGRSLSQIFKDPAGKDSICETRIWVSGRLEYRTKSTRLTRALAETKENRSFARFHDRWCYAVLGFRRTPSKLRNRLIRYAGNYSELCGVIFWLYASAIFIFNVLWFLLKIVRYSRSRNTEQKYSNGFWRKRPRRIRYY